MKIRKAEKKDYEKVHKIIHDNIKFMKWSRKIKKDLRKRYTLLGIKKIAEKSDLFVYEKNKKVLASGRLDKNAIYTVYVSPKKHKTGIGRSIIKYLENLARKRKIKKIKLYALPTAIEFYKKMNFKLKNKNKGLMTKVLK